MPREQRSLACTFQPLTINFTVAVLKMRLRILQLWKICNVYETGTNNFTIANENNGSLTEAARGNHFPLAALSGERNTRQ